MTVHDECELSLDQRCGRLHRIVGRLPHSVRGDSLIRAVDVARVNGDVVRQRAIELDFHDDVARRNEQPYARSRFGLFEHFLPLNHDLARRAARVRLAVEAEQNWFFIACSPWRRCYAGVRKRGYPNRQQAFTERRSIVGPTQTRPKSYYNTVFEQTPPRSGSSAWP